MASWTHREKCLIMGMSVTGKRLRRYTGELAPVSGDHSRDADGRMSKEIGRNKSSIGTMRYRLRQKGWEYGQPPPADDPVELARQDIREWLK